MCKHILVSMVDCSSHIHPIFRHVHTSERHEHEYSFALITPLSQRPLLVKEGNFFLSSWGFYLQQLVSMMSELEYFLFFS